MRWSPPLLIGVAMRQEREWEIPIRNEWGYWHVLFPLRLILLILPFWYFSSDILPPRVPLGLPFLCRR